MIGSEGIKLQLPMPWGNNALALAKKQPNLGGRDFRCTVVVNDSLEMH